MNFHRTSPSMSHLEKLVLILVAVALSCIWCHNLRMNPTIEKRRLNTSKIVNDYIQPKKQINDETKNISRSSHIVTKNASQHSDLKIAWLMSFPNSGTSYTGKLIRNISKMHTASNYGCEDKKEITGPSIPVYHDQLSGPFYVEVDSHPDRSHPTKFVLTKTHCGINCEDCIPRQFLETSFSFRHRCLSSSWSVRNSDGRIQIMKGSYSPTRVVKAIHLIRNPFNNIVSRFHLEQHESVHGPRDKSLYGRYDSDHDAFRAFCDALNNKYSAYAPQYNFVSEDLYNLTSDIPCGIDFIRYTEWHNLAYITTRDLGLSTLTLHYEDYAIRFNETVSNLLDFLELKEEQVPPPFEADKSYLDYFTDAEKHRAKQAIELMSSPWTWQQLKRYFPQD